MLPPQFPSNLYVLDYKRSLRKDERRYARQLLADAPERALYAGAWLVFPWLATLLLCTGPHRVAALPQTPLFTILAFLWFIALVVATSISVCEFIDLALETADAHATLRISCIEVWKRVPLGDEAAAKFDHLPDRIEVVAGTDKTWNQEWNTDDLLWAPIAQLAT